MYEWTQAFLGQSGYQHCGSNWGRQRPDGGAMVYQRNLTILAEPVWDWAPARTERGWVSDCECPGPGCRIRRLLAN
jgi:hypothetical protein